MFDKFLGISFSTWMGIAMLTVTGLSVGCIVLAVRADAAPFEFTDSEAPAVTAAVQTIGNIPTRLGITYRAWLIGQSLTNQRSGSEGAKGAIKTADKTILLMAIEQVRQERTK